MGMPGRTLSKTAKFVVSSEVTMPELSKQDIVDIVTELVKSLKRLGRTIAYQTLDELMNTTFWEHGHDSISPEIRSTRALLLYHYHVDQKFMIDERGNLFMLMREYTTREYQRINITIHGFVDAVYLDGSKTSLYRMLLFIRAELTGYTTRLEAKKRAIEKRTDFVEAMLKNLDMIVGS